MATATSKEHKKIEHKNEFQTSTSHFVACNKGDELYPPEVHLLFMFLIVEIVEMALKHDV